MRFFKGNIILSEIATVFWIAVIMILVYKFFPAGATRGFVVMGEFSVFWGFWEFTLDGEFTLNGGLL